MLYCRNIPYTILCEVCILFVDLKSKMTATAGLSFNIES